MIHTISGLLDPAEIARLRQIAASAAFVDGRISAPNNPSKNNRQLDASSAGYAESSAMIGQVMLRNEEFMSLTFARRFAPPLICRYDERMAYGAHPDAAYINTKSGPLRSDVSCTIFLSDPATYEGGALRIHLGDRPVDIKLPAGDAVIYPSTTIHEVTPVTSGVRLVAITFIESQISDEIKRNLMFILNDVAAIEGAKMEWRNRIQLEHVRHMLHRMWSS
ncbi:MAG: Fe2+-dependent dioxygenase [Parvularculaceae bacterium]|nr:Fe2+-dependent dioxygenase [Parvularculaceae bacterium]